MHPFALQATPTKCEKRGICFDHQLMNSTLNPTATRLVGFGRTLLIVTVFAFVKGQAFWAPFLEAVPGALSGTFLVAFPCIFPGPLQGRSMATREPNGVSLIIPSRVHLRADRHEGEFGRQCSAKHSKAMPWVFSLRSAAEGGSKNAHTRCARVAKHGSPTTNDDTRLTDPPSSHMNGMV